MLAAVGRAAARPPRVEQLALALGGEADAVDGLRLGERRRDGLVERPERRGPAATARETSTSRNRRHVLAARVSTQSGSSIHSPTSCSARNASSTSTARTDGARRRAARRRRRRPSSSGPVALNGPGQPLLGRRRRSRLRGRGRRRAGPAARPGPGTSTSPPRAIRCGQYVKRPVGSCGPTIRPARTAVAAPGERRLDLRLAERLEGAVVALDVLRAGLGELGDRAASSSTTSANDA